ncbi:hypothetical protein [Collimonas pratensis]|uniref:hypothetical protein n=1 Tax=Collimonas pratensis TaxID=279113 RepID=UPI0007855B39|nr:hypothetical protein [Collimonas pratensis]
MKYGYAVEQNADGRWQWFVIGANEDFASGSFGGSLISFATKEAAETDFHQHATGERDTYGRVIRPKAEIQNLVRTAAEATPECADHEFGEVYWHERDASGCNWDIRVLICAEN